MYYSLIHYWSVMLINNSYQSKKVFAGFFRHSQKILNAISLVVLYWKPIMAVELFILPWRCCTGFHLYSTLSTIVYEEISSKVTVHQNIYVCHKLDDFGK